MATTLSPIVYIHIWFDLKFTTYASSTHKLMISDLIDLYTQAYNNKLTDNERLQSFSEPKHI